MVELEEEVNLPLSSLGVQEGDGQLYEEAGHRKGKR